MLQLKNPKANETVTVSATYSTGIIPVRSEWFLGAAAKPTRTFEISKVSVLTVKGAKGKKIPIPSGLKVKGEGWSTSLSFKKPKGDIIDANHPVPKGLFLK